MGYLIAVQRGGKIEVTKALSEHIVNLRFSDLLADGVEGAKLCFLD